MGSPCAGHRPRARSWLQGSHLPVPLHLLQGAGSGCAHFSELIVPCQDLFQGMDASRCAEGCRKGALIPPGHPNASLWGQHSAPSHPLVPLRNHREGAFLFFSPLKLGQKEKGNKEKGHLDVPGDRSNQLSRGQRNRPPLGSAGGPGEAGTLGAGSGAPWQL